LSQKINITPERFFALEWVLTDSYNKIAGDPSKNTAGYAKYIKDLIGKVFSLSSKEVHCTSTIEMVGSSNTNLLLMPFDYSALQTSEVRVLTLIYFKSSIKLPPAQF